MLREWWHNAECLLLFIQLLIFGLHNDTFNISDCIGPNNGGLVNNELERRWKD
jgi:hypothetical protein